MAAVGQTTLVLTTSLTSVKQWRRELLDKTTLADERHRRVHGRVEGDRSRDALDLPGAHLAIRPGR